MKAGYPGNLSHYDFILPSDRIARFPSQKRDESRLMVVNRGSGDISHHQFKDLPQFIQENDFIVMNNTRVIPARLFGKKDNTRVEILIVTKVEENVYEAITRPARRLRIGDSISFGQKLSAEVVGIGEKGKRTLKFNQPEGSMDSNGFAPLPPYIKRRQEEAVEFRTLDLERYQTVYAKNSGSIAAPTAGLHFTSELLDRIKSKNHVLEVTLSVGEATFQTIQTDDISTHRMGKETITIPHDTLIKIQELKKTKNLMAVGTTTVRSLETYGVLNPKEETFVSELFISPGFKFAMVDKLITNFHLPKSSLFILVSALAGTDLMQKAYAIAIKERYRFFSYGDAMLIM